MSEDGTRVRMARFNKSFFEEERNTVPVRINKFLSDAGVCSRREADKHVELGHVTIDGVPAVMGSKVLPGQRVVFCGKPVSRDEKLVLIAFNKPRGIVCTTDRRDPDNIIDFINYPSRIYPIGRLDKDSEGLILLTNNGDIVNKILRAGNNHEKEYIVTVNKPVTTEFLRGMASGVPILDTVTKPCDIEALERNVFRIILTQGLNRQIRRMCEYFDYRVLELQRIRVMNVNIGRLKPGGYRNLTEWELEELNELIKHSSNTPGAPADYDEEFIDCDEFERITGAGRERQGSVPERTVGRVTYAKGVSSNSLKKAGHDMKQRMHKKTDGPSYEEHRHPAGEYRSYDESKHQASGHGLRRESGKASGGYRTRQGYTQRMESGNGRKAGKDQRTNRGSK